MILNGSGDDLSRGSCAPVDQDDKRIFFAAVAVSRGVTLLGRVAAMMRNDQLAFPQELVCDADAFAEQASRILTQVENKTLQVAHLVERFGDFFFRGLVKAGDVQIADSGPDQEVQVDAIARDLIANHGKLKRLLGALAQDGDVDGGALGAFEQIGYVTGAHVVGGLSVNRDDDVSGTNASPIRGRSRERGDDDDLVVAWADGHADAVVFAALVFAQKRVGFRIKEIRVRIEHVEHARNGSVINGFIGVYGLGVVLLD